MACKRIEKERKSIASEPIPSVQVFPTQDLFHWKLALLGAEGTPYEDGVFFVDAIIPKDYPFKPPKLAFLTKVYHPNISTQGIYCLELQGSWHPARTIRDLATQVLQLLTTPNPDDPLIPEIAKQYKEEPGAFVHTATEWTQKYAK
jgi:ubiquitin-conjugating enzyme E2 D/E